ncbi:hypothetical protein EZV62_017093 [Acer yangbiense]|uniref:Uncharacterized protein n=1 Tax=Acer yangbiense TaxID=1000413 RepID=A0A5C7HFG4_9ROSI|nr:hypothetical protein EZV62_017093 [Acer yangbiense]
MANLIWFLRNQKVHGTTQPNYDLVYAWSVEFLSGYRAANYEDVSGKSLNRVGALFITVGFSAIPLTLYVPPIRRLTLFVEKMEDFIRDSTETTRVLYPRLRRISSTFFSIILCCNSGSL